ncbi:unnamed protein product [Nyctereutes procyonoides]|uniref:(raccoon dog) hypothetical protein n=1 Tax=Nyctereutes procyonoides TaxID=34880 RepID=A0A811Z1X7_NYCPR|nr:unnamed protein product [Nyctereutes procyonoides]
MDNKCQHHDVPRPVLSGGWLLLSALVLRLASACPATCAVCTRDGTLCHQLTYIVAAPLARPHPEAAGRTSCTAAPATTLTWAVTILATTLATTPALATTLATTPAQVTIPATALATAPATMLRSLAQATTPATTLATALATTPAQVTIPATAPATMLGSPAQATTPVSAPAAVLGSPTQATTPATTPATTLATTPATAPAAPLRSPAQATALATTLATAPAAVLGSPAQARCHPALPNLTVLLRDTSPRVAGQDVALLTLLGLAGAVGLTCLGLVVFNWKLQQGKANEHTSENLCCRTFDESLCAHEARNYHAKGYCNCHLAQENEIKVTSIVGSRKEMPLLQENSHQAALASESTALDGSFRNLKGKDHGADSTFFCFGGRLLQSGRSEPPGNMAAFNEAGFLTRYPERVKKLRNHEPGEVQQPTVPQHVTRTIDINGDTFSRRYATSASALARESLEKHLTNESWQPPIEKKDNGLQPHSLRHFITGSSSKPCEPEERCVQKILQKHRSKYDDPCGLLNRSRPRYFQPNNSLICKYVPCDQFQDYVKEKKPSRQEHSKAKKEKIQINSAIEKFPMSEDNLEPSRLSTKIKRTYSPKRVSFCDPDLVEKNSLVMSSRTSTRWKQQENQSSHLTNLDLKKCGDPQEGDKEGRWLTDPQILKKKRTNQRDLQGKIKKQNSRIKLNLHGFRKVKVHPEKSLPGLQKKCRQVLLPPSKLSKASQREANTNHVSSADFPQRPEGNSVKLTSKSVPLRCAPKQTSYYQENTKNIALLCANGLPAVNQSSREGNCHPTGLIPGSSAPTLPLPTPIIAEHGHSASQFSTEQMEGATSLALEVPRCLPATWENRGSDVLPPSSSRGATDQGATEPTKPMKPMKPMEQDKPITIDPNQFSLSLGNQTQLAVGHKTDTYKEHTLDQNETFKHVEQHPRHEQSGNEEETLMTKRKISRQIVESCIQKLNDSLLLCSEAQANRDLPLMKANAVPFQNRTEIPKEMSTSPKTQAIWNLTDSGKKETEGSNALPRGGGSETPCMRKILGKEEKKVLDENKPDSSTVMRTAQVTLKGSTKEMQQTWENGQREKHTLYDSSSAEATITAKDLGIPRSPGAEHRPSFLGKFRNMQPDKSGSTHKEGAGTVETRELLSSLLELKDISFVTKNRGPLMPRRLDEAENAAPPHLRCSPHLLMMLTHHL